MAAKKSASPPKRRKPPKISLMKETSFLAREIAELWNIPYEKARYVLAEALQRNSTVEAIRDIIDSIINESKNTPIE